MDEKRNTSITFFVLIGLAFVGVIVYAFIIAPMNNENTLGSSDLVLDSPIQKWNLRYAEGGIIPFCQDGNEWLSIEVENGANVYSASDGVVVDVSDSTMTIEVDLNLHIQYYPVTNYSVFKSDYVLKGESIGRVSGNYLNLRVKDLKREVYECPYNYLNDFSKSLLKGVEDVMGYEVEMCECNSVKY